MQVETRIQTQQSHKQTLVSANGVKHATHRSGSAQTLEHNMKTTIASLTPDSVRAFTATANSCCHPFCWVPFDMSHAKNSSWSHRYLEGVHEALGHLTTDWFERFPMVLLYSVSNWAHNPNDHEDSSNAVGNFNVCNILTDAEVAPPSTRGGSLPYRGRSSSRVRGRASVR